MDHSLLTLAIHQCINKIIIYLHNEILYNKKNKWPTTVCSKMDVSHKLQSERRHAKKYTFFLLHLHHSAKIDKTNLWCWKSRGWFPLEGRQRLHQGVRKAWQHGTALFLGLGAVSQVCSVQKTSAGCIVTLYALLRIRIIITKDILCCKRRGIPFF